MSFTVSEVGGLAVAFSPTDQKTIERELRRLDDRLFLDPEVETLGPHGPYVYMTVKYHLGSGQPPALVLDWRDGNRPKPLSFGLVEQVKRQEGRMATVFREAIEANERKRAEAVKTVGDAGYEIGLDARKMSGKTSALLPRSQALRMARDRARSRGANI